MILLAIKKTTRRDEIYLFAVKFAVAHCGNTPSTGAIAREFGISRTTVTNHILRLVAEHRAEWRDGELILLGSQFVPPPIPAPAIS